MTDGSLNWVLEDLARLRHSKARFVFAAGVALAAVAISTAGEWMFGSLGPLLFAFAVVISTSIAGLIPGLCTAAGAVIAFDFFYIPPVFQLSLNGVTLKYAILLGLLAGSTHLVSRRVSARIKRPLGIHGNLDGIENGEIYGWAFDADNPSNPVSVTVFVDNRPLTNVAAVYYRPDVADTLDCSGRHGFYVDMAAHVNATEHDSETGGQVRELLVDVRLSNGSLIGNAPQTIRVPSALRVPPGPTVLFMHIPKTAGTAFREAIASNYKQSEIAYLYPTPPGFLVSDLRFLPLEQRRALRVVIGHYQMGVHEALPQKSEYITVVRDPLARVLSQYAYLQKYRPDLISDAQDRLLTLEQILEQRLTTDFDNALVRCFSGVDERMYPPGHLTGEIYDLAVHNLKTAFTYVGHQETSAKAFAWLRHHYGWGAADSLEYVNAGMPLSRGEASPGLLRAIQHFNRWDFRFHQEILEVFPC